MKWNLLLLITLALLSMTIPTEAASWKVVYETNDNRTYIDTTSISGGPNGAKEAWFKLVPNTPDCTSDLAKNKNTCIASALSYERHFSNKSFCRLQLAVYFTDGTIDEAPNSCNPERIYPDSVGEAMWKYLYK